MRGAVRGAEVGELVDGAATAIVGPGFVVTQTPFVSTAGGAQSASWVTVGVGTGAKVGAAGAAARPRSSGPAVTKMPIAVAAPTQGAGGDGADEGHEDLRARWQGQGVRARLQRQVGRRLPWWGASVKPGSWPPQGGVKAPRP